MIELFTENAKSALIEQIKEELVVIGNHKEIEKTEFLNAYIMYDRYQYNVHVVYTDKTDLLMWYSTIDFKHYELTFV